MKRFFGIWVVAAAILFGLGSRASAQIVAPAFDKFDAGFELPGWTVDPPTGEGVGWAVDSTPFVTGGVNPSTWAPGGPSLGSLNFNDGVNYEDTTTPTIVLNTVTSPVFDVTAFTGAVRLRWAMCLNMEATFDSVTVNVIDATTMATFFSSGISTGGVGLVLTPDVWFNLAITGGVWPATFYVEFQFSCDISFFGTGAFIDNFGVDCSTDVTPPTAASLTLPAPAATVAYPIAFDWTDATDTSACGVGAIFQYLVDFDDDPAFGSVNLTVTAANSNLTLTAGLPAGTWFWRVRAFDFDMLSSVSASSNFIIEPALAPLAPDTLFVNEQNDGAQNGDGGFVNPVLDEQPVLSAVYRDGNTVDNAASCRYQVSEDPTFTTVDYDSGTFALPTLPLDTRCQDLPVAVSLQRDTVYYWRIQFSDVGGLTGPFSGAQSFRIGDDFEFGVRRGSSHRSRHGCWVATAAWGSADAEPVRALQAWRAGTMERSGVGRAFSRTYHVAGQGASSAAAGSATVRGLTGLLGAAAGTTGGLGMLAALGLLALLGAVRTFRA